MITCELFSHVYFTTPPVSLSCAYLVSLVEFCFQGLNRASKINFGIRLGVGLCFRARFRPQNEARLQLCCVHPFSCIYFFSWKFGNVCQQERVSKNLQQLFSKRKVAKSYRKVGNQLFNKLNIHDIFFPLFCFKSLGKWSSSLWISWLTIYNFFWKAMKIECFTPRSSTFQWLWCHIMSAKNPTVSSHFMNW